MKYGRLDVTGPEQSPEEGRLPGEKVEMHTFYIFYQVFVFEYSLISGHSVIKTNL